jgi:hypothetical protein
MADNLVIGIAADTSKLRADVAHSGLLVDKPAVFSCSYRLLSTYCVSGLV